mmetsp:Transcript_6094/g.15452  ORF Transcript_6094/g.15452 Transcript_6094/m.15452 type:complete len:174 (-) Transcript_6094:63-584(-)|eukprot:CAMPEP_0177667998 /NCGR_PEP_ID=MMETSP0447-20121125/22469_1 /TAXON_ID=0 /ORGANISM="Stygamoeba regulata, Strain BSH-02190019" /LENGTH=173 /DNA_ID=CAMNT_0019174361 /DNA_START=135 /DNA_END=656 /DNA_ORIENTATION=+
MAPKTGKKSSEDVDELLSKFTRQERVVSGSQRVVLFICALLVAAAPVYLYVSIFDMPIESYGIVFAIGTLASAFVLTFSYEQVASRYCPKLVEGRNGLISGQKETREKRTNQMKESSASEARWYSVMYINTLYLFVYLFLAFWMFSRTSATVNYLMSTVVASGVLTLSSAGKV